MPSALDRIRKLCLVLPEAHEVEAWGEPTFRVRNKLFAMYAADANLHGIGRPGVWIKSTHVNQDLMLQSDADRYFSPPYVGPSGWIGIYLDNSPDWSLLAEILRDAYLLTAPKRIAAQLDNQSEARKSPAKKSAAKKARTKRKTAAHMSTRKKRSN
jgi:predicted DNA-binding protein (MmcQ/YjbR family)